MAVLLGDFRTHREHVSRLLEARVADDKHNRAGNDTRFELLRTAEPGPLPDKELSHILDGLSLSQGIMTSKNGAQLPSP